MTTTPQMAPIYVCGDITRRRVKVELKQVSKQDVNPQTAVNHDQAQNATYDKSAENSTSVESDFEHMIIGNTDDIQKWTTVNRRRTRGRGRMSNSVIGKLSADESSFYFLGKYTFTQPDFIRKQLPMKSRHRCKQTVPRSSASS